MSAQGAQYLASALEQNISLRELDVSGHCFQDEGLISLANSLKINQTLQYLNVAGIFSNHFGHFVVTDGLVAFGEMLSDNSSLYHLDLSHHFSEFPGFLAISNALRNNNTLDKLNLAFCSGELSFQSMETLCDALKTNSTLRALSLSGMLQEEHFLPLQSAMAENSTLELLYLGWINHLQSEYVNRFLSNVQTSLNVGMNEDHLDFDEFEYPQIFSLYLEPLNPIFF